MVKFEIIIEKIFGLIYKIPKYEFILLWIYHAYECWRSFICWKMMSTFETKERLRLELRNRFVKMLRFY